MIFTIEHEGKKGKIEVPFSAEEISWMGYVEFTKAENAYLKKVKNEDGIDEEKIDEEQIELVFIEAINHVVKGDIDILPFGLEGDDIARMIDENYIIDLKVGDKLSVLRLYAHVISIIDRHDQNMKKNKALKGSEYYIDYKDERYYLESSRVKRLFVEEAFTVGEVIELKEFRRKMNRIIDKTGDETGQITFNLGLTELALLMRKKGEKLPFNKDKRIKFLNQRASHFGDIDLDKIMKVRFFLLNTLKSLVSKMITGTILKTLNHQQRQENLRHIQKALEDLSTLQM